MFCITASLILINILVHSVQALSLPSLKNSGLDRLDDVKVCRRAFVQSALTTAVFVGQSAHASYIDPKTSPPDITKRVFIDVSINGKDEARIEIGLFGELMPRTVDNFAKLFESNSYAGTNFYRVISDLSIQGGAIGDPSGKTGQSALEGGQPFEPDNFNLKHTKEGLVSAVRGLDGRIDSRFFISCNDDGGREAQRQLGWDLTDHGISHHSFLLRPGWADDRYAAFGIVLGQGMDVVRRIEKVPVKPPKNSPETEVKILRSGAL